MTRPVAILLCLLLLMLFVGCLVLDGVNDKSVGMSVTNLALWPLWGLTTLLYCGFAAVHAVQRVESPHDRAAWMVVIVGFNLLGACLYYCGTYQIFRGRGAGGWLPRDRKS